jgi:preprotein translocase subunit Sec61beta
MIGKFFNKVSRMGPREVIFAGIWLGLLLILIDTAMPGRGFF